MNEPIAIANLDYQSTQQARELFGASASGGAVPYSALDQQMTWVVFQEGDVVAIGGLCMIWNGLAEAWVESSSKARPLTVYRACRRIIAWARRSQCFHRVQATCRQSSQVGLRFLRSLGFINEALLEQYFPDQGNAWMTRILM